MLWGPVRCVVSPNAFHFEHLRDFAQAYSEAKIYALPVVRAKRKDVRIDATLGETPPAEWARDIDQLIFKGNALLTEVDFLHKLSRTLIMTDLCFNLPSSRPPLTRLAARLLGVLDTFTPTRNFRLLTRDRRTARASLRRLLEWDFARIIIAHGDIIEDDGPAALRRAFAWLLP